MPSPTALELPMSAVKFSPLSLARMLWLHKGLVLLIWVLVSAGTAGVVAFLPAEYRAEVAILVDPQKIPDRIVQSMVTTNIQDRLATITAQILSTDQLQKIIDDFNLYKTERKTHIQEELLLKMRKAIAVKLDKGWSNNMPGAFRITYTSEDPAMAAQVANRLANLFIEGNMRNREVQVEGTAEFLDTQLQDAKQRLDEAEAKLTTYKLRHNGELPEQVANIATTLARQQNEQNSNREAIARAEQSKLALADTLGLAESNLQLVEDQVGTAPGAQEPAVAEEAGAPLAPPRPPKASEVLEKQLATLRIRLGEKHPDVKKLKGEIAAAKATEALHANDPEPPPPPVRAAKAPARPAPAQNPTGEKMAVLQARERVEAIRNQIKQLDKEITTRTADQDRLARAVAEAQGRMAIVPMREQEISEIMRDHANLLQEYQSLLGKSSAAKISTEMELRQKSERFTINDAARTPGTPVSPNRLLYDGTGSLIGLGLALVFSLGRELHRDRLLGAWELPDSALVLTQVPKISLPGADGSGVAPPLNLWARKVAVVSFGLITLLAVAAAAGVYLRR